MDKFEEKKIITVCDINMCTGCMACLNSCHQNAIKIVDLLDKISACINADKCINCGLCRKVCPNNSIIPLMKTIDCKQGWAEGEIRNNSSSGGAASALMQSFIVSGGYVASCLFSGGEFVFALTDNLEFIYKFAGSKYVKSNPGTIYKDIIEKLKNGKKVLFVGLPCQSAGVKNYCNNHELLYTADLICHGSPSPLLLKKYIKEQRYDLEKINNIKFRKNNKFGLICDGVKMTPNRVDDSYIMAFLDGVDYTENCYQCRYASSERVSDITLGDAWGQFSDKYNQGVSLILCQTAKGVELLENSSMELFDVDYKKAVEANKQLMNPSEKHPRREKFFKKIKKGRSFRQAILCAMPKESIKQSVKYGLIKMHIMKDSIE